MSDGLISRLEKAVEKGREIVLLDGPEPEHVPWAQMHDDARAMAAVLQQRGVAPGDRVALLGMTSRAFVTAVEASWLAGAAVIVLPLPTRLEPLPDFQARTMERIRLGEVATVVCDPDFAGVTEGQSVATPFTLPELVRDASRLPAASYERPPDDRERTAILQFTSGSTADPKGVVIPERCLLDNLDAIFDRDAALLEDTFASWLPLYHDMGLVANTALALTSGIRYLLAPPTRFMASPGGWTEEMAALGGTFTLGPNFSLAMTTRLLRGPTTVELSGLRRWGSGSEPIDPAVMGAMAVAGGGHGLRGDALFAAYGMAEATVVISFAPYGTPFSTDVVDAEVLELEGRAELRPPDHPGARHLARCGPPIRGMEVRITDPDTGTELGDRAAGEIELRGPSVVPGYFRRPDATAASFRPGGWLRTGDLGYFAEGDLVVCGRLKDVIIVGGRNVFPEDLERAAQTVEGVRAGNVIAFGVAKGRKGDALVVVAEVKSGDPPALRDGIVRAVGRSVGLRLDDVVLVAPGTLPKTSSGKLRRSACRARYQAEELERL